MNSPLQQLATLFLSMKITKNEIDTLWYDSVTI